MSAPDVSIPASDFFRGSTRTEISGESNFTSVGGNSNSSAVQHIFHIHHPSNVYVYNYYVPPPFSPLQSPDNVNDIAQHQPSPDGQVPSGGGGRTERLDGDPDRIGNDRPVQWHQALLERIRAFFCVNGN
ncbi:hypothetical protein V5O48_017485 [Marasmius crinis-equi]|uniref:Uncharacterized protein n=1 Tax=Marasmius crinis-equi TaxID=585013 RepID=A0ABR3EP21_9AGAR